MNLPFTYTEFVTVFANYNTAIFPVQIIAYLLGITTVIIATRRRLNAGPIVLSVLAVMWGWTGVIYHIIFCSTVNNAAYLFGVLFIVQSLLFVVTAARSMPLSFSPARNIQTTAGTVLIIYAMILYPALNVLLGHTYPRMPVFGVTPCPVTIFTFGILLWSAGWVPLYLIVIPAVWAMIGLGAAVHLQIYEDFGLIVAGVLGTVLIGMSNRQIKRT